MTKLEILRSYTDAEIRDTWFAYGEQVCSEATLVYLKEQLYVINETGSALHGCMVYCSKEFAQNLSGPVSWLLATLADYEHGEIYFSDGIVSPNFVMLLLASEIAAITAPVNMTFIPYKAAALNSNSVSITDDELAVLLTDLGVPFIDIDELEYSPSIILNTMVRPALEEYFKWFPKVLIMSYPLTTSNVVEYEFPLGAYDVVHVGITQGIQNGASNILLRYFDEVVWSSQSPMMGHVGGRRAPKSLGQDFGSMMMDRAVRQGMINYGARVHHSVIKRDGKKYLSAYSNKMGSLQVHFAMQTLEWDDVEFARRPELRELARSNILRAFGSLRSQAKADIPGAVDYSQWITRADDLRTKVITEWMELVKSSGLIRGSM